VSQRRGRVLLSRARAATTPTPREWVLDDFGSSLESLQDSITIRARLCRIEALLECSWNPYTHCFFLHQWKAAAVVFRVGTWFLSRLQDRRECARSVSWLLWAWTMPYLGYGWMAEGWHLMVSDGAPPPDPPSWSSEATWIQSAIVPPAVSHHGVFVLNILGM
jgi:hypothetical protein